MSVPDDGLGSRERAALLVLMAEGRELTNAELRELAGFTIDGACRRRLNELGLVTSTKVGIAYVHELTDDGAVRCAAELSAARPARSGSAGGALYSVLAALGRHLDNSDQVLADLLPPNVVGQVEAAHRKLTRGRGGSVRLAVLREALAGIPREDVDHALETLARRDGVHVWAEADQKTLTEDDHAAAIVLGSTVRHLLTIEAPR